MKRLRMIPAVLLCLLLLGCGELMPTLPTAPTSPTLPTVVVLPDENCIPYVRQRYLVQQLPRKEFYNLCALYESARDFDDTCKLPFPTEKENMDALLRLLQYECPELIQLDLTQNSYYTMEDHLVVNIRLPFCMDKQEYGEKYSACEEIAKEILQQAENSPDAELAIYDYITDNCTYDAEHPDAATIYGVLVEGYGKCDGLSLSYKWLLEQMGRTCLCIAGDPPDGGIGHAWNVVEVNGEFYDVDVTADTYKAEQEKDKLYPAYHVDQYWVRNRYVIRPTLTLLCELPGSSSMEESYHAEAGNFIEYGQDPDFEKKLLEAYQQESSLTLQFADKDAYTDFVTNLKDNIDTISKNNKLKKYHYACHTQDTFCIIKITVERL